MGKSSIPCGSGLRRLGGLLGRLLGLRRLRWLRLPAFATFATHYGTGAYPAYLGVAGLLNTKLQIFYSIIGKLLD